MSALPAVSCGLAPGRDVVDHARLAEELGYARVWLYDSPALYGELWSWLAVVAQATDRIGLGTGVAIPHLRHVMTTAAAIATVETIAPGRLVCGFGTGASSRWTLGQEPLSLAETGTHLRALRRLLAGEVAEVDGAATQMLHRPELVPPRPLEVPLLLSAIGPKGQALAREVADGVLTVGYPADGWDRSVQLVFGTVLDDGEDPGTERVREAVGPWYALVSYHGPWEDDPAAVDDLPGGRAWRERIEAERPPGRRHLAVHEGHATHVTDRDRPLVDAAGDDLGGLAWIDPPGAMRERLAAARAGGATEVMYTPAGPDLPRELTAFAAAAGLTT